jgi:hypothetical protein
MSHYVPNWQFSKAYFRYIRLDDIMKQVTISLKDAELKALLEIKDTKEISSLHKAIKMAITDFIKNFEVKACQ